MNKISCISLTDFQIWATGTFDVHTVLRKKDTISRIYD